jgi:CDP-diacylglycerol--glycerol-3-phosphate 3-phosphatidyltransferase
MASYHSYAAKLWGFLLAASAVSLLTLGSGTWLVSLALVWGIASELEVLAMSMVLPEWTPDVKTLVRAIAIRRDILARQSKHIAAG